MNAVDYWYKKYLQEKRRADNLQSGIEVAEDHADLAGQEAMREKLEKAAEQDVCEVVNCCSATSLPNDHIPSWVQDAMINEFVHGAEWKKEQFEQSKIEALKAEYERGRADALAEWTEEDDLRLNETIYLAENHIQLNTWDISWLKSLRTCPRKKQNNQCPDYCVKSNCTDCDKYKPCADSKRLMQGLEINGKTAMECLEEKKEDNANCSSFNYENVKWQIKQNDNKKSSKKIIEWIENNIDKYYVEDSGHGGYYYFDSEKFVRDLKLTAE